MNHHHFHGKDVSHVNLSPDMTMEDLIETYSGMGYNGRQLGEAARLYARMIESNATICLTVSGALTPVGMGGVFKTLIEKGFVDWIIATGANVYHEDHFAWGLPVKQGHWEVDDNELYKKEIVRIRDIYLRFYETLEAEDQVIQKMFKDTLTDRPFTTAEFTRIMGKTSSEKSNHPERSFVNTAYKYDVPVYISTLKDSSLALNLAVHRLRNKHYYLDIVREILEQGAILYNSAKSGIVELGGGVPKNTAQQTGPLLDQILRQGNKGQDYVIQITDARPDTGGLSGATLQEGKSWGKMRDAHNDMVTVYADTTIAFPLLALYVLSNQKPRTPKRLYKKLGDYYEKLRRDYFENDDGFYDLLDDDFHLKRKVLDIKI